MRIDTPVTRLLGLEVPILQGAMSWLSPPELVAAVSNQGGLGVLAASALSAVEFERLIERTQVLTSRPFAVNFALVLGDYREHLDAALSHGVRIVVTAAGSPKLLTPTVKAAGACCLHVVPNLKLAESAVRAGVDGIILESVEAGGHLAPDGVSGMTNIPLAARELRVPLIAAGGIVDGRGMAAAMCLGAQGVQLGTRFLATRENNAHPTYHRLILDAGEADVPLYSRLHHPGRALRTPVVERVLALERDGRPTDELRAVLGRGRPRRAAEQGDLEEGLFFCGAGAPLITDVPSVEELFRRILAEFSEALRRVQATQRLA